MTAAPDVSARRVAIIGGGLAGLAAAAALCERGVQVELFEARRQLGGRAGSFLDQESGEWIDHCQHVALGCCTSYLSFCRRTGVFDLFRRDETLPFIGPDGECCEFRGVRWWPAPLHLLPALLRLRFLTLGERLHVARTMRRLALLPAHALQASENSPDGPTIGQWLREQGESGRALSRFWSVVLVSALSETLDRASLAAARHVFVEGFMANRQAYELYLPTVPLSVLYQRIADWLASRGVRIHLEAPVAELVGANGQVEAVRLKDGSLREFDQYLVAVPWRRIGELFSPELLQQMPALGAIGRLESAPISSVHLWFDRRITDLPHAVLIDRLSQWLFAKPSDMSATVAGQYYYQVVISASRDLVGRSRDDIVREVVADLAAVFPSAQDAKLVRGKVVTDAHAVFAPLPGLGQLRPASATAIRNLFLAGDWTATGWPSTMEGAVRSGDAAAVAAYNIAK